MLNLKSHLNQTVFFILMIFMLTAAMTSCQTNKGNIINTAETPAQNQNAGNGSEGSDVSDDGPKLYEADYLPDANYSGYVFRMVAPDDPVGTRAADVEED